MAADIRTIVIAGDSHTWGQGSGGEMAMGFPLAPGELRPMGFQSPSYVNLLREKLEAATGSGSKEYGGAVLASLAGVPLEGESALVKAGAGLTLPKADLYRVVFQGREGPSLAELQVNGEPYASLSLTMPRSAYMYRFSPVFCGPDGGELELRCKEGDLLVYRIEAYSGPFAVINSGLGSCPLSRYLQPEIWEPWVASWRPAAVVMEGNTINDWLAQETPEEYEKLLEKEIAMVRALGACPFLHTVAPILGPQAQPHSPVFYPDLVEAARKAARRLQVPLADTNKEMEHCLAPLAPEDRAAALFSDPWHPNPQGHAIYAQELFALLSPFLSELKQ